jgi:hypothetical protein
MYVLNFGHKFLIMDAQNCPDCKCSTVPVATNHAEPRVGTIVNSPKNEGQAFKRGAEGDYYWQQELLHSTLFNSFDFSNIEIAQSDGSPIV